MQYPVTDKPAQASATGAPLSQTSMISVGRFCFSNVLKPTVLQKEGNDFLVCGTPTAPLNDGGSIVVTKTSNSKTMKTVQTTNSLIPVKDRPIRLNYPGIGPIEISFELRSPNGFLNYLGSWYNFGDKVNFDPGYDSVTAQRIFGRGPYLSIVGAPVGGCYSSIIYQGQTFCVPSEASHTAMLMDLAVILRNLNVQPSDLNAPFTVRLAE